MTQAGIPRTENSVGRPGRNRAVMTTHGDEAPRAAPRTRARKGARPGESGQRPWRRDPSVLSRMGEARSLWAQNIPVERIAVMLGVDAWTVHRDLKRGTELIRDRLAVTVESQIETLRAQQTEAMLAYREADPKSMAKPRYLDLAEKIEMDIAKLAGNLNADVQVLQQQQVIVRSDARPEWLTAQLLAEVDSILDAPLEAPADLPALPARHHVVTSALPVEVEPEPAPVPDEPEPPARGNPDAASHPVIVAAPARPYGGPAQPRPGVTRSGGSSWYDGRWDRDRD
jgi:hypothetical protein